MKQFDREYLRQVLNYDPLTGRFEWKVARQGVRAGMKAGSVNSEGYLLIKIDGKSYKAHSLVFMWMYGFKPNEVDHINHVRTDNRVENLREVIGSENRKNRSLPSTNTSGCAGVHFRKDTNKWTAYINSDSNQCKLGCFDNLFEAACVRKSAERRLGYHENHGVIREACEQERE